MQFARSYASVYFGFEHFADQVLKTRAPNFRFLILATVARTGDVAPAQVRFGGGIPLVRCKTNNLATAGLSHPEKTLPRTHRGRACFSSGGHGEIERAQIAYFRCTLSFKPVLLAPEFSGAGHQAVDRWHL